MVAVVMAEEDTGEDLVEVDFMAEVLEDIPLDSLVDAALVVDGTEEAVTGEDVAITRTEDTPIPTTFMGIGLCSVILMAGATESGCRIIEGRGYFLVLVHPWLAQRRGKSLLVKEPQETFSRFLLTTGRLTILHQGTEDGQDSKQDRRRPPRSQATFSTKGVSADAGAFYAVLHERDSFR